MSKSSVKSLTGIIFLKYQIKISRPLWFIMALKIESPTLRQYTEWLKVRTKARLFLNPISTLTNFRSVPLSPHL